MKLTPTMRIAIAVLVLLTCQQLNAQALPKNQFKTLFPAKIWDRPHFDSTINVTSLSQESCYQLIERMFVVDQQYRDSLHRFRLDEIKSEHFGHLMMVNDPVNQAILLKILKRYGWPCDQTKRQLSSKTWFIAWHARGNLDRMLTFYPYLVNANNKKCINHNQFAEFRERVNRIRKVRTQWVMNEFKRPIPIRLSSLVSPARSSSWNGLGKRQITNATRP